MHTCISSHGLKRSWRSCPRRVNASNKNIQHAPSTKTECDYLNGWIKKKVTYAKISPKSGEPQKYSWGTQKTTTNKQTKNKKTSPLKEFWGNGVRTHVNSKGKIPSTRREVYYSCQPKKNWRVFLYRFQPSLVIFNTVKLDILIVSMIQTQRNWR